MENNDAYINKNNGINDVFKNQPEQEEAYVYTLMIYDNSSKEEKTSEKIISYRNMYGYFSDYSQLLNVDGIGEKKLDNLMEYI